ncbi:MAG: YciI family protein [Saprospiraceae bacterium]|nr:YciI family protein [Saprospiraceae bacterium]
MKNLNIVILFLIGLISCDQKDTTLSTPIPQVTNEVQFDSLRAVKVGADQYGMKQYVMAFLKKGPNRDRSKEDADRLQKAHMENIGRLAEMGKLVLAGPFLKEGDLRGIYIFDVTTEEEAKSLVETDPAIQEGSLVMELVPWYGSAALMEVGEIHEKISKINI